MTSPEADLADAVHRIRERALRQVMALVNRLQPPTMDAQGEGDRGAYVLGHRYARMQLYAEIEQMIAREAPVEAAADPEREDGE